MEEDNSTKPEPQVTNFGSQEKLVSPKASPRRASPEAHVKSEQSYEFLHLNTDELFAPIEHTGID